MKSEHCPPCRRHARLRWVAGLLAVAAIATATAVLGNAAPPSQDAVSDVKRLDSTAVDAVAEPASATATAQRIREGTELVDRLGSFKLTGDRATFHAADGKMQLVGLENLNLERIIRSLTDAPDQQWTVTGTVTEFRGANYLLISRAVLLVKPNAAAKPR